MITNVETLKYFDPTALIKISWDASDHGLGCVLLQEDRPVHYASRTLTEKNGTNRKKSIGPIVGCK